MELEKINKRIQYLKIEISHGGFWDGYALEGMKKELKELTKKLQNIKEQNG
jgi:hypothetical protein